jgi:hypothetical protein
MILKDGEIEIRLFGVASGLLLKSKHIGITHLGWSLRGVLLDINVLANFWLQV